MVVIATAQMKTDSDNKILCFTGHSILDIANYLLLNLINVMDGTPDYQNLTPESALLVKALMDPYYHMRKLGGLEKNTLRNIDWVASKDFTVGEGERQIREYIKTWELPSCWLYSLDFLGITEEEFFTFYHYRTRFSTPTPRNPIVGTASVYFVVNKVKPENLPVDVHYVIESNRLVNKAGSAVFREKWLTDVIDSKTLLRKAVADLWTE